MSLPSVSRITTFSFASISLPPRRSLFVNTITENFAMGIQYDVRLRAAKETPDNNLAQRELGRFNSLALCVSCSQSPMGLGKEGHVQIESHVVRRQTL